jgi:hypothetical protein
MLTISTGFRHVNSLRQAKVIVFNDFLRQIHMGSEKPATGPDLMFMKAACAKRLIPRPSTEWGPESVGLHRPAIPL